jgi:uncharacterized membrane protein
MHDGDQHTNGSAARFAAALLGGALLGLGRSRKTGVVNRLLGAGVLATVFAPTLAAEIKRAGAARRRVHLQTTLYLDRPVHEVFTFCQDFENFPHIIQSLQRIVDYRDGRSHWEVSSHSGEVVAWDAEVTKYVPNTVIAWQSLRDAVVDCGGVLRFSPTDTDGTRLEIEVHYDPRSTGLTEALRALLDTPREVQLRADLDRANFYLKSLPAPVAREEDAPIGEAGAAV